jgi:hypothetical protein
MLCWTSDWWKHMRRSSNIWNLEVSPKISLSELHLSPTSNESSKVFYNKCTPRVSIWTTTENQEGICTISGIGQSWSTIIVLSYKEKPQTISSIQLRCMAWKEKLKRDYKHCGSEKVTIVYTLVQTSKLKKWTPTLV